ncbi:MAG TPA: cytochrome c oxidase assembly factor Coa1 family protein [Pyrinomonadaceae bacterium]|nr:cytochrome c oxidase assembly factor Coa1 family protein [Pyrinomonadaceae bacterium]
MGTKKIVIIVGSVVVGLGLIVALFVGGILFLVFHTIGTSAAADTARTYLRNNERLKQDIGEVKDFGSIVSGNINLSNGDGVATLNLKVIGEKGNAEAQVELQCRSNRDWRVTGASYNRNGQTIDLMQAYGSPASDSP